MLMEKNSLLSTPVGQLGNWVLSEIITCIVYRSGYGTTSFRHLSVPKPGIWVYYYCLSNITVYLCYTTMRACLLHIQPLVRVCILCICVSISLIISQGRSWRIVVEVRCILSGRLHTHSIATWNVSNSISLW